MKDRSECSWANLKSVYSCSSTVVSVQALESRYEVVDETSTFRALVNTSVSSRAPFHRWVRYREGYAGDLVKEVLRRYPVDSKRYFVMDPMVGSGSTLVAAAQLGLDAVGSDVSGYAVLSSRVKTAKYLKTDIQEIEVFLKTIPKLGGASAGTDSHALNKYFNPENLAALVRLEDVISSAKLGARVRSLLRLALLSILEDCSNRKKDGNGLATRPTQVSDVRQAFLDKVGVLIEDLKEITPRARDFPLIEAHDETALRLASVAKGFEAVAGKKLGCIVFSPPYANSFDYFESYKLELIFGGYVKPDEMNKARTRLIRSYRLNRAPELDREEELVGMLCKEIERRIPEKEKATGVRDGRTRLVPNMLRGYFADMQKVIEEGYEALAAGGAMHIVVDQSSYLGVPVPTDTILAKIAEDVGFKVKRVTVCRTANTSGQQLKVYPYLRLLLRESIVTLIK
jgi:site-specific DNA-methyltransferase (adenine-specific)